MELPFPWSLSPTAVSASRSKPGAHIGYGSFSILRGGRRGTMALMRQLCAGILLVTLTVVVQSAGMAALILWARTHLLNSVHRFGVVRAAVLVVRFTGLILCLHMVEILIWACLYRWQCFSAWEPAFYFSLTSYSTVGYGDL